MGSIEVIAMAFRDVFGPWAVSTEQLRVLGRFSLRTSRRGISVEPTKWPRAISLGALLTLTILVISSCTEGSSPGAEFQSPTVTAPGPVPTVEVKEASTLSPTPTVVDPVTCKEGMFVPKGSGCRVPPSPSDMMDHWPYDELRFEVDQSGRASLHGDGQNLRDPQQERIEWGVEIDRDYWQYEGGEVTVMGWWVLVATANDDGSWTIEELWHLWAGVRRRDRGLRPMR